MPWIWFCCWMLSFICPIKGSIQLMDKNVRLWFVFPTSYVLIMNRSSIFYLLGMVLPSLYSVARENGNKYAWLLSMCFVWCPASTLTALRGWFSNYLFGFFVLESHVLILPHNWIYKRRLFIFCIVLFQNI